MLLVLVIILILIWAAVVWSIYSNFLVFYSNFNESENYHKAYYNSIIALERAELVTKQRAPWYIWSGWRILGENTWNSNSDRIIQDESNKSKFSYISDPSTKNDTSVFRTINSRTTRIPKQWEWDIESMLSYYNEEDESQNSNNFNMMDYNDSQVFLLYYDNSNGNPYEKTSCPSAWCTDSKTQIIKWVIRLPWYMYQSWDFWNLDTSKALVNGGPTNDAIVDRQIRWIYSNNNQPFTIFSTQSIYYGSGSWNNKIRVNDNKDNAIRENDINPSLEFTFWRTTENKLTPIPNSHGKNIKNLTVIGSDASSISNEITDFSKLFSGDDYKEKQLRFSLLNLLQTESNMIYPFLEYYTDFWTEVSDKYFTINAEWNYYDYKINMIVRLPTIKESVLWSFTTIF